MHTGPHSMVMACLVGGSKKREGSGNGKQGQKLAPRCGVQNLKFLETC